MNIEINNDLKFGKIKVGLLFRTRPGIPSV